MNQQNPIADTVSRDEENQNLRQVQEEATSVMIVFSFLAWLALVIFGGSLFPHSWQVNLIGIILVILTALAYLLLEDHYLASTWVLVLTWTLFLLVATVLLQPLPVACLLVLPVTLAALFISIPAGTALAVFFITFLFVNPTDATFPFALSSPVVASAAMVLILAVLWLFMRSARFLVNSSLQHFKQGRIELEQARDHQGELGLALKDLAEANQQMARLNQLLNATRYQAEEAERVKTEFVANVSHELRTPLNMIIGYSEMIMNMPTAYGKHLPQALLADIDAIYRNSQHLTQLINDVLDISQVEARRMTLNKEWVSLVVIAQEAISAVQPFLESRSLYCNMEAPADSPSLLGDRTRIRQVLLNLISNAARVTEKGGITITITFDEHNARVQVSDTGPGIAPSDLPKLFEAFRQVDGTLRRKQGGSGLGLSISRRFVELHGGQMGVESQLGVGSTFWFTLPIIVQPAETSGYGRWISTEYEQRHHNSMVPRQHLLPRLVILEEQNLLQDGARRYLDDVLIETTSSLAAACELLDKSPAEVALVRGSSPEQTQAWVHQLTGVRYPTPIIGCLMPSQEPGQAMNIKGYLVKPVSSTQLLEAVQSSQTPIRSILIVDDDSEALRLYSRILTMKPYQYRILQAGNGSEALNFLHQRHVDLMLLDLSMPDMDGLTVLEEKDKDPALKDIPVFILSATDPDGQPLVASSLTVTRGKGLSLPELLRCSLYISEMLSIPRQKPVQDG